MICTPITLPVRLTLLLFKGIGLLCKGVGLGIVIAFGGLVWVSRLAFHSWPARKLGGFVTSLSTAAQKRSEARAAARAAALQAEWFAFLEEMEMAGDPVYSANFFRTYYGPPEWRTTMRNYRAMMRVKAEKAKPTVPPEPSVPSRLVTLVANGVDRMVAFFQARPAIGEWTGKIFVRGVFYPFLVVAPVAMLIFLGSETARHYHGLFIPLLGVWWLLHHIWMGVWWGLRHLGHGGKYGLRIVESFLLYGLLSVATFLVLFGIMYFILGGAMKLDYMLTRRYLEQRYPGLIMVDPRADGSTVPLVSRPSNHRLDRALDKWDQWANRVLGPADKPKFSVSDRFGWAWGQGKQTTQVVIAKPVKAAARTVAPRVKYSAIHSGRGIKGAGKFLVMGHHAVKSRTCPNIRIVEDERV